MSNQNIHPSAMIEEGAEIGDNVTIEPYAVIKKNVKLKDNVVVKSHAYIEGHTTIGKGTVIYPSASIGCQAQALNYRGERTFIEIGENCQIREFVTINSSLGEDTFVRIGDNCMIMAYCHIAHNSLIGKNVIMSNNAAIAGHVTIGDHAIIGGKTPIHQYVRVGKYAMVGGFSRVGQDIPPYTIGGGIPYKFGGLNLVGLKRHGFPIETRRQLAKAFRFVYRSKMCLEDALICIEQELEPLPEIKVWLDFCRTSRRGIIGLGGITGKFEVSEDTLCLEEDLEEVQELTDSVVS